MAAPTARRRITPLPRRMAPTRHRRTRVHRPTPTPRTPARPATTRRATLTTGRPAIRPSTMATTLASTLATPITRARTASLRTPTLTGATRTIGRLHEYTHGRTVFFTYTGAVAHVSFSLEAFGLFGSTGAGAGVDAACFPG